MADIEERAARWADHYIAVEGELDEPGPYRDALIDAYLAGSAQTQADYVAHYESQRKGRADA